MRLVGHIRSNSRSHSRSPRIDRPESAECDDAANRVAVFRIARRVLGLKGCARGVRCSCARRTFDRRLDRLHRRDDDQPVDAGEWNLVARLQHGVLRVRMKLRVRLLKSRHLFAIGLGRHAVVVEVFDRNRGRQCRHIADVIDVVMRRNQMVDLRQPRGLHRFHDAARVAFAGKAGIDQQRFP